MKKPLSSIEVDILNEDDDTHAECKHGLRDDIQRVLWAYGTKHGADGGIDTDGNPVCLVTKESGVEIVANLAMLMGSWGETLRQMGIPEDQVRELISTNHKIGRESAADNEVEPVDRRKLN